MCQINCAHPVLSCPAHKGCNKRSGRQQMAKFTKLHKQNLFDLRARGGIFGDSDDFSPIFGRFMEIASSIGTRGWWQPFRACPIPDCSDLWAGSLLPGSPNYRQTTQISAFCLRFVHQKGQNTSFMPMA